MGVGGREEVAATRVAQLERAVAEGDGERPPSAEYESEKTYRGLTSCADAAAGGASDQRSNGSAVCSQRNVIEPARAQLGGGAPAAPGRGGRRRTCTAESRCAFAYASVGGAVVASAAL